jgi:hypothetical protein
VRLELLLSCALAVLPDQVAHVLAGRTEPGARDSLVHELAEVVRHRKVDRAHVIIFIKDHHQPPATTHLARAFLSRHRTIAGKSNPSLALTPWVGSEACAVAREVMALSVSAVSGFVPV